MGDVKIIIIIALAERGVGCIITRPSMGLFYIIVFISLFFFVIYILFPAKKSP